MLMQRQELTFKQEVIGQILRGRTTKQEGARLLGCTLTTIYNYLERAAKGGLPALKDGRRSNRRKLTSGQLVEIVRAKREGPWRSARKVLELTRIRRIGVRQVQRIWVKAGLNQINLERLKPIQRFVAKEPNDLWQADIMGKIRFPYLGEAYLIANIDDHSRFILGAKWFARQTQLNVFRVWYHCLFRWGLPKAMLQDKGSQYRSAHPRGEATYQHYAQALGINLVFAHRARTKGKIERLWRFLQQDFVRENLDVRSLAELNRRFFAWQVKFNEAFKSEGLGMGGQTPAEVYQPSERRRPQQELQEMLTLTLRRYVYTDSTISLFGQRYRVPPGYIKCRIWLRLRGEKVVLEAMGKTILKFRLRV